MRGMRSLALAAVAVAALSGGCKKSAEKEAPKPSARGSAGEGTAAQGGTPEAAPPQQAGKTPEGCNSDFSQPIQANYTLTRKCSPYTLNTHLAVDGWDLTIEPGVEIRFGEAAGLDVGNNANSRLFAKGTAEAPIRLVSGGRKEPGFWDGLALFSNAARSEVEHLIIENAGHDDKPAIRVDAEDVKLSSVKVVGVKKLAVAIGDADKARLKEFGDNDFTEAGNQVPGSVEGIVQLNFRSISAIAPNNRFAKGQVIELTGALHETATFKNPGVPYRIKQTLDIEGTAEDSPANISFEPGVILQMGEGTAITFGYNAAASLKAEGMEDKPIVFTRFGADVTNGSWKGLTFHDNAKPPSLRYVRIEYAGDNDHAAVRYAGAKGLGKVTHCTIAHSAGAGIEAEDPKARFEDFSDNTFEDIAGAALHLPAEFASGLGANNKYPANSRIEISGDIHKDTTLTDQGTPYVVQGTITVDGPASGSATLTLEPGTQVRFTQGGELVFGYNEVGQLKIQAPADKPVVFAAQGDQWQGLTFKERAKVAVENIVLQQVADDRAALTVHDGASGSIKGVTVKGAKRAVQDCSAKLTVSGVKGDGAKADAKEGC